MTTELKKPKYIGDAIRWGYIKRYLPKNEGGVLLDVGAGMCEYRELAESKGYSYVGIDINPNSPAIKGNACDIPFESGTFDVILAIDCLEHIKNDEKAVSEMKRVLKNDGIIIIHSPNKAQKHILIEEVEEQDDHVRKGYDPLDFYQLFYDCKKHNCYPTFDRFESMAWDLYYAINTGISINPLNILDVNAWKEWNNYGWVCIIRK